MDPTYPNIPTGISNVIKNLYCDNVPPNLHDLPHRMLDSVDKLMGEIYEAVNAIPPIRIHLPPFLEFLDNDDLTSPAVISVPVRPPLPPPTFYDRVSKYTADHPYIATTGVLGVTALGVSIGYSLQDEDSFLRVAGRRLINIRQSGDKQGYRLGTGKGSGTSFLAGLRGGASSHLSFAQGRAERLKGRKIDGMLKDAILIMSPTPFPALLLPLVLSLLNNDYIVFVAVPGAKDADELERKVKANEKIKAKGLGVVFRVLVYDPADSTSLEPFQRSLWASLTLRYPSSTLAISPTARATHPPGDPYAPEPTHLASLHSIISLYALHPTPDPSLGQGGRLPAIPSFLNPPLKNSAGQVIERPSDGQDAASPASSVRGSPALITLHHTIGLLPIPVNFAEQLITSTNLLLAKNVGITHPRMRITNVGIGEIDYYSSIVAHSFTHTSPELEPGVMRFLKPIWTGFRRVLGLVGVGQDAKEWKVVERKLLRIVKHKYSGSYNIGSQTLLPSFLSSYLPSSLIAFLFRRTDLALLFPSISRLNAVTTSSTSTSNSSSTTFTSNMNAHAHPQAPRAAAGATTSFTPSTASLPDSSGSERAEGDSSEFESSVHTGLGTGSGSGVDSLSGSGYVGMDGSWVGLDSPTASAGP
ncbi:hypothetical protein QFC22_000405 [Naganishia vaughanmartiniae]|uniref:Uncharacterized protein n=1 Tax=Naganishia vaughanmartiniae TaxID=1424756 RepID=A0ACC2XQ08_9TREE|nr:hypothetical protein QFC22_000405 [Naganishia vaughanmartiniae]